jgi:hypothetical protein
MDSQEPSPDQRKQLLRRKGRTGAEWEELSIKVLLLYPDTAKAIRDTDWSQWRLHNIRMQELTRPPYYADQVILMLGAKYEPYPLNRIAKALRKLRREALQALHPEARKREYARNKQR